jgi:hypothetical protein
VSDASVQTAGAEWVNGRRVEPTMLAVAVAGSLLVHSALFLSLLAAQLLGIAPASRDVEVPDRPAPFGLVPARLVRLGEQPEKGKLPDRIVPALPTAPDDGVPVADKLDPPPPKNRNATKRPLNPVEDDKVRDVLSRIRAFGEITDNVTTTGDPSGVPEGDVGDPALAQAGSLWARQVCQVIKAYVVFPTIIPQEQLKRLKCKVELKVGRDRIPMEAKIAEKGTSHNRFFDQAVLDSFEEMRIKLVKLPPPPQELEENLYGPGLIINIYGRDLD